MTEHLHLLPRHRAQLEALLSQHLPGVEVWAYGSRVKGQSHDGSDLDLVLRGSGLQEIDLDALADFSHALHDSTIPFLVEARDWARLPERFHREIEREYVVVREPTKHRPEPAEWLERTWGDLATLEYGKSLRGYREGTGTCRVFGTNGPIGWHTDALADGPGVVIGRKGAYRGVHYSPEPFFVIDTAFYLKPKTDDDFEMRWAYYELLSQDINGLDSGSAIPSTSRDSFYSMPVQLPPPRDQRAIAHILGTLDDKIELNRRMNETLEAMVRALFKSWFIDFDPVRAKIEGWDTGLPQDIAALFPDRLADSEIGEIPEGWAVAGLAELIEINPRRVLRRGEVAPYLPMATMPTRGHVPTSVDRRPFGSGMRFANGDTLVARITPCLENGKTAYVDFLRQGEVGWGSTEYIVLKPKPPLPDQFAYCLARSAAFREFAIRNMSGTSGRQRVSAAAVSGLLTVSPPVRLVAVLGEVIEPLFKRASRAARESRLLSALRDTLLPKLISGEIRVPDAESLASAALSVQ